MTTKRNLTEDRNEERKKNRRLWEKREYSFPSYVPFCTSCFTLQQQSFTSFDGTLIFCFGRFLFCFVFVALMVNDRCHFVSKFILDFYYMSFVFSHIHRCFSSTTKFLNRYFICAPFFPFGSGYIDLAVIFFFFSFSFLLCCVFSTAKPKGFYMKRKK